ncbi:MAG: hypothetical protein RLZZ214_4150, partial [Verrucomicrobiota bacterium]|jgi:hypothetical protein
VVSGIAGPGVPSSHSYSVTLIDPNRLTADLTLFGPSTMAASQPATFTFTPPTGSESLQVRTSLKTTATLKENAEVPARAQVIDGTGSNYPLMVKPSSFRGFGPVSGRTSFHLTFPTSYDAFVRGVPEQSFELNRDIIVNPKASLTFKYRRGYMTKGSNLVIERSADGGLTWSPLGKRIRGVSNTKYDLNVSAAKVALPRTSTPIRLRFRYFTTGGSIYTHDATPTSPTGIFIDDITITGCSWLVKKAENTLSASSTQFVLDSQTAGGPLAKGTEWYLTLRAQLGGKWFPDGPAARVTITP